VAELAIAAAHVARIRSARRRRARRCDAIARLLELGFAIDGEDAQGATALIRAAGAGHAALLLQLLDAGADAAHVTRSGMHVLAAAVAARREAVVRTLLNHQVAPDTRIAGGGTTLTLACAVGEPRIVDALLEAGADANALDDHGGTPLHAVAHYAFSRGDADAARAIFERLLRAGAQIARRNRGGQDTLLILLGAREAPGAHCDAEQLRVLCEWLVDRGAAVDTQDERGVSALHACALHGLIGCARLLKAHGAPLDLVDAFGRNAADVAALVGYVDVAAELGLRVGDAAVPGVRQTLRRPARAGLISTFPESGRSWPRRSAAHAAKRKPRQCEHDRGDERKAPRQIACKRTFAEPRRDMARDGVRIARDHRQFHAVGEVGGEEAEAIQLHMRRARCMRLAQAFVKRIERALGAGVDDVAAAAATAAMLPNRTIVPRASRKVGSNACTIACGACRLIESSSPMRAADSEKSSSSQETPAASSSADNGGIETSDARMRAPGPGSRARSSASVATSASKRSSRSAAIACKSRASEATSSNAWPRRARSAASARPSPLDAPTITAVVDAVAVTTRSSASVPNRSGHRGCARQVHRASRRSRRTRGA
jgi:ankyrin repeat protein